MIFFFLFPLFLSRIEYTRVVLVFSHADSTAPGMTMQVGRLWCFQMANYAACNPTIKILHKSPVTGGGQQLSHQTLICKCRVFISVDRQIHVMQLFNITFCSHVITESLADMHRLKGAPPAEMVTCEDFFFLFLEISLSSSSCSPQRLCSFILEILDILFTRLHECFTHLYIQPML